ncbi:hypothetical protein [Pseudoduganella aquatica]|uniref:Uncharacterized protein n=1 Tax=Pseudoduganella aquatica TaxID=2660641 RepID=A0A7X4H9Y8_9BURK|nr:hypothetical protein [Pseudoduganella aquatica]MYN07351.1 hypothetical protein [Pseudoduganella aquatica]
MKIFASVAVICTRLCCALLGFGMLFVSIPLALVLNAFSSEEATASPWQMMVLVIGGACLLASGFVMFAVGWRARSRERAYRGATFALLLVPLAAWAKLMTSPIQFPPTSLAVVLSAFTVWLLLLCAWPELLETPMPAT